MAGLAAIPSSQCGTFFVALSYLKSNFSKNSFGYGGANAHAILDSVQSYLGQYHNGIPAPLKANQSLPGRYYVLPFSAHNDQTLNKNIRALSQRLRQDIRLSDLTHTLESRRSTHSVRAFSLVSRDANSDQLADALTSDKLTFGTAMGPRPEIAFVFTGQGAQWAQMGLQLIEQYAVVRNSLHHLGDAIARLPNAPQWDLLTALAQSSEKSQINDAKLSQPLTTAIQIAMIDLLRSWGVLPTAVVGHSSGEIAAAYCSGHITATEAIIIAYQRGAATAMSTQHGAMLAVGLGPDEALDVIRDIPSIGIACYNAPDSVTLSGSEKAIEEARSRFMRADIFNRKLITSGNAYHSALMEEAGKHYEALLEQCVLPNEQPSIGLPGVTMFSSVTGEPINTIDLGYWRKNLESPVRFDYATQNLLKSKPEVKLVVEIGPHSALAAPLKAIRTAVGYGPERLIYLPALKRNANSVKCLLSLVGSLFVAGYPIPLSTVNAASNAEADAENKSRELERPRGSVVQDLPPYQWVYEEGIMWHESRLSTDIRFRSYPYHDLLGSRLPGTSNIAPAWRNMLNLDNVPWLRDHQVADAVVFPAAGYVALAIEAVTQVRGSTIATTADAYTLRDVKISSAMVLKEDSDVEIMFDLRIVSRKQETYQFVVSTVSGGTWTEHATGAIQVGDDCIIEDALSQDKTLLGGRNGINKDSYDRRWYSAMDKVGLVYGQAFRTLSDIRASAEDKQATAEVSSTASDSLMAGQSQYSVHPTTLDACLQLSIIAAHGGKPEDLKKAYLPISISKLKIWPQKPGQDRPLVAVGRGKHSGLRSVHANAELSTSNNELILQAETFFSSLERSTGNEEERIPAQPYTRLVWKPDVDRLTNAQAEALFHRVQGDDPNSKHFFSSLDELTRLAIMSVEERLPDSLDVNLLPGHMQKFVRWLKKERSDLTPSKEMGALTGDNLLQKIASIAQTLEGNVPEAAMVAQLNAKMPQIVTGAIGALDVMVENDLLSHIYEDGFGQTGAYAKLTGFMELVAHKNPRLRILELGAGTGGATRVMLKALDGDTQMPKYERYDFTDVSKAFLGVAQERFQAYRHLEFGILDIENDPDGQNYEEGSYDIVFASNVSTSPHKTEPESNCQIGHTRNTRRRCISAQLQETSQAQWKACRCRDDKRLAVHWIHAWNIAWVLARSR